MGVAYAEVEYEVKGKRYHTTHGLWCGANNLLNTFAQQDYIEWGGLLIGDADFEKATDPANNTVDPRSIIEAILYFHRYMQHTDVTLRGLSINDGATPGDSTGNFVSVNLDLQCRGNPNNDNVNLAGLNTAMLITKSPAGFSKRKGHIWLRGAIGNGQVTAGDEDGVQFLPGFRAAWSLALFEAINGSGLGTTTRLASYMQGGPAIGTDGEGVNYVIPTTTKYTGIDPETGETVTKRALSGYTVVDTLAVTDAQSRKARRRGHGKKPR
jgi:hypothetical protein